MDPVGIGEKRWKDLGTGPQLLAQRRHCPPVPFQGQNSSQGSSNEVCGFIHILLPRETSWSPHHCLSLASSPVSLPRLHCLQMNSLPQGGPLNLGPSVSQLPYWVAFLASHAEHLPLPRVPLHCLPPSSLPHSWPSCSLSSFPVFPQMPSVDSSPYTTVLLIPSRASLHLPCSLLVTTSPQRGRSQPACVPELIDSVPRHEDSSPAADSGVSWGPWLSLLSRWAPASHQPGTASSLTLSPGCSCPGSCLGLWSSPSSSSI